MAKYPSKRKSAWGVIEVRPANAPRRQSTKDADHAENGFSYYWRPKPSLENDVPKNDDFCVMLRCRILDDGTRVFFPAPNFDDFVANAQLAGLAILIHQKRLGEAQRNSYRFNWFLYQYARRMQQFVRRKFHSRRDLQIPKSGGETRAEKHILPWDRFVKAKDGTKLPQNPDALMAIGEARAIQENIQNPSPQQRIQYGFIEVAESLPRISLSKAEIRGLLRSVLFDIDSRRADNNYTAIVHERLGRALDDHLDDATMELFNAWLWGPKSNVIKQIAKQRKAHGGEIDRDEVRQALLELGWQAYSSVAKCMEAIAIDYRETITPRLNRRETRIFNRMFLRQKCFGGLSLVMLSEQLDFVAGHFGRLLLQQGESRELGIFYRLLSFYAIMIRNRRAADKRSKKHLHGRHPESSLHPNIEIGKILRSDISKTRLDAIAAKVCETQGLRCGCEKPELEMGPVSFYQNGTFSCEIRCQNEGCLFLESVHFSACDYQGLVLPD